MPLRPDVSYIRCTRCGVIVCERETDEDGRGSAWIIRSRGDLVVRCPARVRLECSRCGEIRHLPDPWMWRSSREGR